MLKRRWQELPRLTCVLEDAAVARGAVPVQGNAVPGNAPTRRALLAASAALPLLLTACKGVQALGTPPPPAPDVRKLRAAISAEELLVATYAAAVQRLTHQLPARPGPGDIVVVTALSAVRAEHAAHLAQLRTRLVEPTVSTPSPSPTSPAPQAGSVTAELAALEQAEQAASDRLIGQLAGLPPSLAQLFASVAASEATHVPFLRAARRGR
jgi:hypothetical protein